MRKINKTETGNYGEQLACEFLTAKGYDIICKKFRSRYGEIDIIAQSLGYIVFVEVKYRRSLNYGYPREAVNMAKQSKIRKTAEYYIYRNNLCSDFRYDVIEIIDKDGMDLIIEHIENSF